jgi:DNA protecting protein DprA
MNESNSTRLRSVKGIGPKRYSSILTKLAELRRSIDDLFQMPAAEIAATFKIPKQVAQAISTAGDAATPPVTNSDFKILKRGTPSYPKKLEELLADKAPPVLHVWGNLDLLNRPAVGFCGSRHATAKGIEVTADTARQIVEQGWVVVSGHARGVDTMAHRTALENGGSTIIVAPEGISRFRLRRELKQIAKPENILIISEFEPEAGWSVGRAMTRNKTIIGLSDAMILVEARLEGGTFEAGKAALRLKVPLYVAQYQTPGESAAGNEYFLKHGAHPLLKSSGTGKANIDHLRQTVARRDKIVVSAESPNGSSEQLLLPI